MTEDAKVVVHSADPADIINDAVGQAITLIVNAASVADVGARLSRASSNEVRLPMSAVVAQLRTSNFDEEWLRSVFGVHCARYAVIAMIGTCEQYLESLLMTARVARALHQAGNRLSLEELVALRTGVRRLARRTPPEQLVPAIVETLGMEAAPPAELEWMQDIYALRSCLVHRGGRVDERDAPSGTLTVRWRRPVVTAASTRVTKLPFHVEQGGPLTIKWEDTRREWPVGEVVDLSEHDCNEFAQSLATFVQVMAQTVYGGVRALFANESSHP